VTAIAAETGGAARTRPTIAITGSLLRPVRDSDRAAISDLLHAPSVRLFLCDDQLVPPDTIDAILRTDALDAEHGLGLWMIERAEGGTLGLAGIRPLRDDGAAPPYVRGVIEPIIALYPHLWGQGLAAAALGALIGYARCDLNLDRLVAMVDRPNARSHALMRRLGFSPVRTMAGPTHEVLVYVLELEGSQNECPDRT